jgi:uncharacterized protein YeeX (DUF496 family)
MKTLQELMLKNKKVVPVDSKDKDKGCWKEALKQLKCHSLDNLSDYIQVNFSRNSLIDFNEMVKEDKYENMTSREQF